VSTMQPTNIHYHETGWARALALQCNQAQTTISLCAMSLLVPRLNTKSEWAELWQSWCTAVQRGVRVDIWLAAPQQNAAATKGNASAGSALVAAKIGLHFVRGNKLLHAKTAVIDMQHVWIGSGNFTLAAATENHEAYISMHSPAIAQQITQRLRGLA